METVRRFSGVYSIAMNTSSVALGLNGVRLKNKDLFSKSDPYVVISRSTLGGRGWVPIRTSETKQVKAVVSNYQCNFQNNLNPEWSEFLIYKTELPARDDEDLR